MFIFTKILMHKIFLLIFFEKYVDLCTYIIISHI